MDQDDVKAKALSKTTIMKNDLFLRDKLKKIDNIGVAIFFAIPLILFLLGGASLAHWVALLWPLYSLGFVIYFRKILKTISNKSLQMTRMYSFYALARFILIGFPLVGLYILCQVAR